MIKKSKVLKLTLLLFFVFQTLSHSYAQIDSPYSRYGLGKLSSQAVGPLKGMGGIGYGVSDMSGANPLNPASYAQIDSLTMAVDFGVYFSNTRYKDQIGNYNRDGGGLEYVTILFKATKNIAISAGLLPFSKTAYQVKREGKTEYGDDEVNYIMTNVGSGGLSTVYLGASYKTPLNGLTVGANLSYLFGKINQDQRIVSVSSPYNETYVPYEFNSLNVTTARLETGLQYTTAISKYKKMTIGAVYYPKINGTAALTRIVNIGDGSTEPTSENVKVDTGIPEAFGFGFSIFEPERWLFGVDVGLQKWKDVKFTDLLNDGFKNSERFNNRTSFAIGGEYCKAIYSRKYVDKIKYRGGFNYNNSYINIMDSQKKPRDYKEYGGTIGFGFPLYDRNALGGRVSYLNLSFEYKHLKPDCNAMVSENYFGISLNMDINELWFFKRKIY